ncbi:Transcriptional regulator mntR Manganese transport regulator [Proteiniborus sp. DW1]|uniref:metal-dependent transcriptional regulator n=1 Tax=Proteiniborus sp. DW1 TaxID=1889883 RepID=UPI00092DFF59|nr:iron dependent repressor, metal binding and dimerization domain protein [Proteiniborus sp. DW1]SCG84028.1 Transcriptional regulator mntR Manganese transport regulator [Proteiniborus sp. DW1]
MLSPSLEDYLEEAYRLSVNNKEIRIKDVAECLNVSMPSVVKGLRKLNRLGYLIYQPYEKIELTDRGKMTGFFLVERNKILKDFVSMIGSDCDIKQEAEAMEHYLTISTIKSIEKLVKFFSENESILQEFRKYQIESVLDN